MQKMSRMGARWGGERVLHSPFCSYKGVCFPKKVESIYTITVSLIEYICL